MRTGARIGGHKRTAYSSKRTSLDYAAGNLCVYVCMYACMYVRTCLDYAAGTECMYVCMYVCMH